MWPPERGWDSISQYFATSANTNFQYLAGFLYIALLPQHLDCGYAAFLRISNIGGSVLRYDAVEGNTAEEGMRSCVPVLLFLCETLWRQWQRRLKESCEVAEIMCQDNKHRSINTPQNEGRGCYLAPHTRALAFALLLWLLCRLLLTAIFLLREDRVQGAGHGVLWLEKPQW